MIERVWFCMHVYYVWIRLVDTPTITPLPHRFIDNVISLVWRMAYHTQTKHIFLASLFAMRSIRRILYASCERSRNRKQPVWVEWGHWDIWVMKKVDTHTADCGNSIAKRPSTDNGANRMDIFLVSFPTTNTIFFLFSLSFSLSLISCAHSLLVSAP